MASIKCYKCKQSPKCTPKLLICNSCRLFFHESCLGLLGNRIAFIQSLQPSMYPICGECDCNARLDYLSREIVHLREELEAIRAHRPLLVAESFMFEIVDRIKRAKNIIVYNFPESPQTNEKGRLEDDRFKIIQEILSFCFIDVTNINVKRIGPYVYNRHRPLRVFLNREQDVRIVLQSKGSCTNGLTFTADRTTMQRQISKNARAILNDLRQQGRVNIEMKFIRGIPYLIEIQPQPFQDEMRALVPLVQAKDE